MTPNATPIEKVSQVIIGPGTPLVDLGSDSVKTHIVPVIRQTIPTDERRAWCAYMHKKNHMSLVKCGKLLTRLNL